MAEPKAASVDEFMSKRQATVGKTTGGQEAVFKGFVAPASYDPAKRAADFVMSSETVDRMGDIVRQEGLDLTRFLANPQGLLFHSSRTFPIGQWENVKKKQRPAPKRTEGTFKFAPAGGPIPEIDQSVWAVENGLIRTVSIGFMPRELDVIEHDDETRTQVGWSWGFDIKTSELLECSLVPIPAQPDAIAKGMIANDQMPAAREFLEKALDEWARDPRTGMLVPRKELEGIYTRFFGSDARTIMALDAAAPKGESALGKIEDVLKKDAPFAWDGEQLTVPKMRIDRFVSGKAVSGAGGTDAGVNAISGTQIIIMVEQPGGTGSNTRTGEGNGDEPAAAGGDGATASGGEQRSAEPAQPSRRQRLVEMGQRIAKMLGRPEPEPPAPVVVKGSLDRARARLAEAEQRLAS